MHSQGDVIRDASGRAVRKFGTQQDITALRESERRLEAAQRLAHVGWWERDYATGHVSLSDEACRIFGVQPLDLPQWHGRWLSLIHPEDRESAAAASDRRCAAVRATTSSTGWCGPTARCAWCTARATSRGTSPAVPFASSASCRTSRSCGARSGGPGAAGNARPRAEGGTRGGIRLVHRRARERKPLVARARGDVWPGAGHVRSNVPRLEEAHPSRRLAGGEARDQACARIGRCRRPSTGSFTRTAPCTGCRRKAACSSTPRADPSAWSAS